jgi:predicted amidophosphoribosyltransferase
MAGQIGAPGGFWQGAMPAILRALYPPRCLSCGGRVAGEGGLCPGCWAETPFVRGLACDGCGAPLPGRDAGRAEHCDDCLRLARPWSRGRAALVYKGAARRMVLALKHGDRHELVPPMAGWMAAAAAPIVQPGMLLAPVPLDRWRYFRRRYNQAALLGAAVAKRAGLGWCPDLLQRIRRTGSQEGRDRDARFANLEGAIRVHPGRKGMLTGRRVLLIDDVMTSGATLAACAEACRAGGAQDVCVLVLARVAKDA